MYWPGAGTYRLVYMQQGHFFREIKIDRLVILVVRLSVCVCLSWVNGQGQMKAIGYRDKTADRRDASRQNE